MRQHRRIPPSPFRRLVMAYLMLLGFSAGLVGVLNTDMHMYVCACRGSKSKRDRRFIYNVLDN